ncbi:hypothetical protein N7481_006172 [Penicillium waksmanii]|uniref:uncharacterized protein n=1 Tax=Penicillium waksmanii TaxID=69791 RepID=UPI0025467EA1|nr:uncharacterized protein N7481_006172 [Penicillium waksmanii]KAJ5984073.1 hypothetical protein N7481_006172 [Penicillium waksmanii]
MGPFGGLELISVGLHRQVKDDHPQPELKTGYATGEEADTWDGGAWADRLPQRAFPLLPQD